MSEGDYSKRLLVVRLSALGDVAILEPVLRQRAAANPEVLFLVAGPPRLAPLFRDMANVEYIATERRQKPRELYRMLGALKPDKVADMHHVLRTIGMDWLFRLHGVPVHSIRKRDARGMATWRRYDRVFDHCGLKGGAKEEGYWSVKPADGHQRVVGVAPFAQHKGKIWPLEQMERLVEMLSEKGYRVVLFGSGSGHQKQQVPDRAVLFGGLVDDGDGSGLPGNPRGQYMGSHASVPWLLRLEAGPCVGGAERDGLPTLLEIWEEALPEGGLPLPEGDRTDRGDREDRGGFIGQVMTLWQRGDCLLIE